jgi:hypothetical protein
MPRLKDRNSQIPYGLKFALPEVGYRSREFDSFSTILTDVSTIIRANPGKAAQLQWPTDETAIANWIDAFNSNLCQVNGWNNYITDPGGGPSANFMPPSPQEKSQMDAAAGHIKKIWSGVRTLNDWIDSGEPAVPQELSNLRAATCTACPKNGAGDFTSWFTAPAAAIIQRQVGKLADRKLSTQYDDSLGVCQVCLCPLKLKCHTPMKFIVDHLSPEVEADLIQVKPKCWIISEMGAL